MRELTDEERDMAADAERDRAVYDELKFVPGKEDGSTTTDLPGYVYLHLRVIVEGDEHSSLSGWYTPGVIARIKARLGVESR